MPRGKIRAFVFVVGLVAPSFFITACVQKGPAQRAGASLDQAVQDMKDAVDPPGPAQKAGRALDRAIGN